MPYKISKNAKGRYIVTSPAGKTWKATYATPQGAQKGIDYILKRSGGARGKSESVPESSSDELSITPGFATED